MSWLTNFITSSIGQKLVMSFTGLFLISFLVIHLAGNLQLLNPDSGKTFNEYAHFMVTNPFIKGISYGLYLGILLHAIQGLLLAWKNKQARGARGYRVTTTKNGSFASKNMALLGTLILVFIGVHLSNFWYKMKFGDVGNDAFGVKDLHTLVTTAFQEWWIVLFYVLSMVALFFHLQHGFFSAFQSLGLNHKKYTPFIKIVGNVIAIVLPLLFAIIPILMYLDIQLPFSLHIPHISILE